MRKIVVNRCYGGFGLSHEAQKLYAKKKGIELFFYKQTQYRHEGGADKYERLTPDDDELFVHASKQDFGESFGEWPEGMDGYYFSDSDIERDDPDLVEVVEELGESANGRFAKLDVVEIPPDISWIISEYDGRESVDEAHRSW